MRKRLSGKLLSVILTIAICATTVFGCLITAYATEPCYKFGSGVFAEDDLTQATIDVTFTAPANLPDGFSAGQFSLVEVDVTATDYLIIKSVAAVTGGVTITESEDQEDFYIFETTEEKSEVIFKITVGFSNGEASKTGKEYKLTLNEVELANSDAAYHIENGNAYGTISAGCTHVVKPVGSALKVDEVKGYSVYESSVCTRCGETFGYQIVPVGEDVNAGEDIIDLLEFGDYLTEAGSASKYYDTVLADNGETGADWDNAIIIDNAEEFVYLAKASGDDTAGKYYKVADGIAGFDLSKGDLNLNGTLAENLDKIKAGGKNHAGNTPGFQGNFDGNGATVYGAWTNHESVTTYAGLFGCTKGDVTIKNINVKLSYFVGKNAAGGIVGYHSGDGTNSLIIENCSVTDTYIETQGTAWGTGVGAIVGHEANLSSWKEADKGIDGNGDGDMVDTIYVNGTFNITNCYVNLDPTYFVSTSASTNVSIRGGLVGWCTTNAMKADKCVVIGVTPYGTNQSATDNNVQHAGLESHFTNIYTDTGATQAAIGGTLGTRNFTNKIFILTKDNMKGSAAVVNMPNLDWGTTWIMDGTNTYPRLALPGETSDTIYWDGSVASSIAEGSGTKDDPYVINTAAELAWLVQQKADVTDGNYYKIADGIESIVLQPYAYISDIKALDSASAVKSYFESGTFTAWKTTGWEGACFAGYFDGNGATIYGMYATSTNNAALFCTVDGGAAFVNLIIKNSYLTSSADNYQVGALIGTSSSTGYGAKRDGIVWVKNITVANNYLYNGCLSAQTNRSGVIGCVQEAIQIENVLVYGNDATYGRDSAIYNMPLLGNCYNTIQVAASHYDGLEVKTAVDGEKTLYYNQVKNSIILGADVMNVKEGRGYRKNDPGCFTNVYTDCASGTVALSNGEWTYTEEQIKAITAYDALGAAAETAMPNLTWGTDWFVGGEGEYPAQSAYVTIGAASSSNPDFNIVGTNIVYEDDGSFSLNIHYIPEYEGFAPTLYVGDTNCTKLYILDTPVASSKRGEIGNDTAMMFTLKGISAKDIGKLWHPTLVAQQGASLDWSRSAEISVAKTATATIEGNYDTADKNVAAAVLMYGGASLDALNIKEDDYNAGTIDLLEFGSYLTDAGSTSTYWDTNVADNGETGDSWENAIIIDSAEELVYLCKASGDETKGLYYKVADGIAGFDLSKGDLNLNGTLAQNIDKIKAGGKNHAGNTPGFQGHFDGNGATVYGAWTNHESVSTYVGLFSCTFGEVTIKNIHVNKAHFTGKNATGGIIGYHKADDMCTVTIENCSITDSYLETQGTGYGCGVGAIIGYGGSAPSWKEADKGVDGNGDGDMVDTIYVNVAYNIKNCYVNLDEQYFVSKGEDGTVASGERVCHGGVAGILGSNALMVSNCVVIGITPYATMEGTSANDVQHSGLEQHFANVYTTEDVAITDVNLGGTGALATRDFTGKIFPLSEEQLTGAAAKENMTTLDWINTWTITDGYPTFINKDYKAPASGLTIYWDGSSTKTAPSVGSGTKEDPYIISSVAELAYIFGQGRDNYAITLGKYYKLADGITSIVMQPAAYASDIMALGSAADAKAYFEDNAANMKQWLYYGWEGSTFCGNIDFNGATVYGIYQVSTNNAGLISNADAGAVISNLTIKNSYMVSQSSGANYQVGAIVANTNQSGYGQKATGFVWFNNCIVANNYMYNNSTSHDRSGVIIGASSDIVYIDNCLTYGNDATYGDAVIMPVWSSGNNSTLVSAAPAIPDGLVVDTDGATTPRYRNKIRNSMIFGNYPYDQNQGVGSRFNDPNCYNNVYTDMSDVTTFFSGIAEDKIAVVTADKALGAAAQTNMPNLDWSIWHVGTIGDYPGFKEAGALNSGLQAIYDGITLTPDTYNDTGIDLFGLYATSVNLNSNPYMSFAFEFGGELKEKRDEITITFTYTVNGQTFTKTATPPAFEGDGTVNGTDGWYNRPSAGRFHTYRFKDIPVEALANPIVVSANYGGTDYELGTVSVGGLAYEFEVQNKLTPSDYYATRIEAVKALLFYTQMIHARYGAQ